ncbi:MAG: hypothetical protein U0X73_12620 [Thermoanaerobaculia bacterium]
MTPISMKLLLDTDVFCKLQLAGLLDEAVGALAADLAECGRLAALPHMLRRGRLRKMHGAEACDALAEIAQALPVLPQPSDEWLDKLVPIEDVDVGEAQLFAAAAEFGLVVVSGDKRALRALKDVDGFAPALAGRIVVLEAVLLALLDQTGTEALRERIGPIAAVDSVVRISFSSESEDPRVALVSYFESLRAELKPLVLWDPRAGGPA